MGKYLTYLSKPQCAKLRDDVNLWLQDKGPSPVELKPALISMVAHGMTKPDAENVLRDEEILSSDMHLPATYWYGIRRMAESENTPPAGVIARRLLVEETSVGALQRSKKLGIAFDAVASAVEQGDFDRSATLIRLAEAIRQDEAMLVAMDAGEDVAMAMQTNSIAPDRVSNSLSLSALDELTNILRNLSDEANTHDGMGGRILDSENIANDGSADVAH